MVEGKVNWDFILIHGGAWVTIFVTVVRKIEFRLWAIAMILAPDRVWQAPATGHIRRQGWIGFWNWSQAMNKSYIQSLEFASFLQPPVRERT